MEKEPPSRKSITLPQRMWEDISAYRFDNRITSEAEAVRRVVQAGLDALAKVKRRAK
jgi:hypothetical protein